MTKKPWSGRFTSPTLETVEAFTESVSIDCKFYKHDIAGSIAHAKMLSQAGILNKQELKSIINGLTSIKADIASGKFIFDKKLEDVHMNIETELVKRIGPAGKKLHTARSRNDQVATDFRLYLKDEVISIKKDIKGFLNAFVDKAKDTVDIIMPGFTHLQHAQPVSFGHHMLAYFQMFLRDYERFSDLLKRINVSPLGSAALAGTSYPIDRDFTAKELGFDTACRNSIDAVSDRDFAIEFVFASSVVMMHLSRLAEELILWNSQEFSFIGLPDAYCTGSSIMPQKKNPDVLELIRGKVGGVYGNLISLLTLMKGLPLAYNRDMQEDKTPAIDSADTLKTCIEMATGIVTAMDVNKSAMEESLKKGFITATDVADYLARKGVTFRDAHRITGELVAFLIKENKSIDDLSLKDFKKFSPKFEQDIIACIDPKNAVDARTSFGGTARKNVKKAIKNAHSIIEGLDS